MNISVAYISGESLYRPEVVRWRRRIKERYTPPEGAALAVLLPCSATKPYSASPSHRRFIAAIKQGSRGKRGLVHEVILTSPLALVPRELENLYPACCYDTTVTGHWSGEEKEILAEALRSYAAKFNGKMLCYAGEVYAEVCESLGIEIVTGEKLLSEESLRTLEQRIRNALQDKPRVRYNPLERPRKIADFQFGPGAGDALIRKEARIRRRRIFYRGEQIAAISEKHGYIALTLRGGELLKDFSGYVVELGFFPESNNIFTPGIEHAGGEIRPGDEVIAVYGDEVVGVGRALLSGGELVSATRGLGVVLRHRRKV